VINDFYEFRRNSKVSQESQCTFQTLDRKILVFSIVLDQNLNIFYESFQKSMVFIEKLLEKSKTDTLKVGTFDFVVKVI